MSTTRRFVSSPVSTLSGLYVFAVPSIVLAGFLLNGRTVCAVVLAIAFLTTTLVTIRAPDTTAKSAEWLQFLAVRTNLRRVARPRTGGEQHKGGLEEGRFAVNEFALQAREAQRVRCCLAVGFHRKPFHRAFIIGQQLLHVNNKIDRPSRDICKLLS